MRIFALSLKKKEMKKIVALSFVMALMSCGGKTAVEQPVAGSVIADTVVNDTVVSDTLTEDTGFINSGCDM